MPLGRLNMLSQWSLETQLHNILIVLAVSLLFRGVSELLRMLPTPRMVQR